MCSSANRPVSLEIRTISTADQAGIRKWPPYTGDFAPLDYALREGGWLDAFPESETCRRLALLKDGELVGFSLLTDIRDGKAEFYIAIHPSWVGQGVGQEATRAVLAHGFRELGLQMIYLKVRSWHERGIHIYRKMGFSPAGEKTETIQGVTERFIIMEARRPAP